MNSWPAARPTALPESFGTAAGGEPPDSPALPTTSDRDPRPTAMDQLVRRADASEGNIGLTLTRRQSSLVTRAGIRRERSTYNL